MKTPIQLVPALLACLGLAACDSDKATGTMDDTNQSAMARVYLPDHKPAAKAEVLAWKVNDTTAEAAARTETSSDGSYSLGMLPDGLYRVVARKDGLVAMQDSMTTVAGRLSPRDDTLRSQAVATGTVKMTGSDNPSSVTILVMGTDVILYNVDKSGSFRLEGLATGTYRLRLSSTNGNYTTTAATIRVTAGRTTDVGAIHMNFTGTPPVDSLKARIDTVKNHVVLSWKLPEVRDFRFVRVYREPLDGSAKPAMVGYSTGNTFRDSVFEYNAFSKEWLYTVRIHTLDGDSGYAAWAKVTQKPVARRVAVVRASVVGYDRYSFDSASLLPGTTHEARVVVFSSPDRPRRLSWSFQGHKVNIPTDSIDATGLSEYPFADSFKVVLRLDSTTGDFPFVVGMETKEGIYVADSVLVRVRVSQDTTRDTTSRDSTRWTDTVRVDTTHHDTTVVPRDSVSVLHLRIVNESADTLVAGSRLNVVLAASSGPYRARSVTVRWNGTALDTALPGANDSTRHSGYSIDSLRLSLDVGTATGPRTLYATVFARDGKWYSDSIRVYVIAPKSKSVASVPILVPATAASHEAIASLARKPDSEG